MNYAFVTEQIEYHLKDIPNLSAEEKAKFADKLERLVERTAREVDTERFNKRLELQAKGEAKTWFIPTSVKDDIYMIATCLPAMAKAKLMNLAYDDILALKKEFERGVYGELVDALNGQWVDRCENEPLNLLAALDYLEMKYTPESFTRLAKQKKLPKDKVESFLKFLKEEYKQLDPSTEEATA
jgi:hypothetical protein